MAAQDALSDRGGRGPGQAAGDQPERDVTDRERASRPGAAARTDAHEGGRRARVRTGGLRLRFVGRSWSSAGQETRPLGRVVECKLSKVGIEDGSEMGDSKLL